MAVEKSTKRTTHFNCLWSYYLYQCCQYLFEEPDEGDFFNLINLRCEENSIIIRSKEKYRFCYFLYVLAEEKRFTTVVKDSWLAQILKATGIKKNYYTSHYRDPLRDDFKELKPNKDIVAELKEAISKIRGKV